MPRLPRRPHQLDAQPSADDGLPKTQLHRLLIEVEMLKV